MDTTSNNGWKIELTVTKVLVETFVDGGERLQCPVLTCRGETQCIKYP